MSDAFTDGEIRGVIVLPLVHRSDPHGSVLELFRIDALPPTVAPSMCSLSHTEPGGARGPHEHASQTDVLSFVGPGSFSIWLWDGRAASPTLGRRMILRAGADNPVTIVVPPGVVHAWRNTSAAERGMVLSFPDRLVAGWGRRGPVDEVVHEDGTDSFCQDFSTS